MKHKPKIFNLGRSTYFHHHYGVYFRRKRTKVLALYGSVLFVLAGSFIAVNQFVIPAIRNINKQHPVAVNSTVFAEPTTRPKTVVDTRHEDEALKDLLEEKIASFPKDQNWSVFVYDLNDHGMVNINSDRATASASLYKLFLLQALEARIPFDKWADTWLPDGTNVQSCVQDMLTVSDNACSENLGNYLGWDFIDQLNQKNGFKHTNTTGSEGRKSTAADLGELLIKLQRGQVLSDKARRFVFDTLYQQSNNQGITAGCNNCRAADKIGEITGISNDAGIVTHGNHSYVLVVMSEGGSLKQIADIAKTIESQ